MDLMDILRKEKVDLLEQIACAAKAGESNLIMEATENLRKVEALIERHQKLEEDVKVFKSAPEKIVPTRSEVHAFSDGSFRSAREQGKEIRNTFLSKLSRHGIPLQKFKGETLFKTKTGGRVGIAVATERQPDRWFLGLPADGFDHAVLLCKRDDGEIVEVLLPHKFFLEHIQRMSQSKGQLKFNVARRGNVYMVQVPGTDGINPHDYARDYSFLS